MRSSRSRAWRVPGWANSTPRCDHRARSRSRRRPAWSSSFQVPRSRWHQRLLPGRVSWALKVSKLHSGWRSRWRRRTTVTTTAEAVDSTRRPRRPAGAAGARMQRWRASVSLGGSAGSSERYATIAPCFPPGHGSRLGGAAHGRPTLSRCSLTEHHRTERLRIGVDPSYTADFG